jgi:hypothetical protein
MEFYRRSLETVGVLMDIIARRQTFLGEGGKRFIGMTQPWDFEGGAAHLSSD